MGDSLGDKAAVRRIIEQVLEAEEVLKPREQPLPLIVKWLGGVLSAISVTGITAFMAWLVTSTSNIQNTMARMDERQTITAQMQAQQFKLIDERFSRLEGRAK